MTKTGSTAEENIQFGEPKKFILIHTASESSK